MFGNGNIVVAVVLAVVAIALISWGVKALLRRFSNRDTSSAPLDHNASGTDNL